MLDLGLFSRLLEPLQRQLVFAGRALLFLEIRRRDNFTRRMSKFRRRGRCRRWSTSIEHAVADFQHGDIEGAAAEVVDPR